MSIFFGSTQVIGSNEENNPILTNLANQGLEYTFVQTTSTPNVFYDTWTTLQTWTVDGGDLAGTQEPEGIYFATVQWGKTSGLELTYYFGSTSLFGHNGNLTQSLSDFNYLGPSTDYDQMSGGGSYGERLRWRILVGADRGAGVENQFQVYWTGRNGFARSYSPSTGVYSNSDSDPVTMNWRLYSVSNRFDQIDDS